MRTKLGLFNLMGLRDQNTSPLSVVRTTVDMVEMAEDLGFDIAWFAEHHFTNHSICPSALLMIANCAPRTQHIRLGSAVVALPFHNPIRLVQEIAFVDLLTQGRLVLGLGSGYQPLEFDRFGIDPATKHDRFLEMWDIIDQGLIGGAVAYEGRYYTVPPTTLSMRSFGIPMPDIFVASREPRIVARCVAGGHTPFVSYGYRGLSRAMETRRQLEAHWSAAGGDPATMPLGVQRLIYVTDNEADALHAAACVRDFERAWQTLRGRDFEQHGAFVRLMPFNDEPPLGSFLDEAIIGSPETCIELLRRDLAMLKPTHLCCMMGLTGIGRSETLASFERFGTDVLPYVTDLLDLGAQPGRAA